LNQFTSECYQADMSKPASFTVVSTVICLSVLMSLEADAQSTTDETNSCGASSLEKVVNLVERIASVQQVNGEKMEKIASNQQENAKEIKKIASKSCESEIAEPSKQALVSALVSECFSIFNSTHQHTVQKNPF